MADITIPLSERQRGQFRAARADVERAQLVQSTYAIAVMDAVLVPSEQRHVQRWDVTEAGLVVTLADPPAPPEPTA